MPKFKTFEDFLASKHAEKYVGLDDDMPDQFNNWLIMLEPDDWIKFGDEYRSVTSN